MREHGRRRSRERLAKKTPCQPYYFGAEAFVFTGCLLLSHRPRRHPDDSRFRPRSSESTTEAPRDGSSDRRASSIQDPALGGVVAMRQSSEAGRHTHTRRRIRERRSPPSNQPHTRARAAHLTTRERDHTTGSRRRRRLSKY